MEGKAPEAEEGGEAAAEPESCCVFETVVREGREVVVCVATCCGAAPAAS